MSVRVGLSFALLVTLIVSAISPVHDAAAANYNFSPKNGPPGTSVHVTVSGTPAKADLTVHGKASGFDADLCSFTTDNNGKGGCSFKVPHVSGTLSLTLTGPKVGSSDIGPFDVTNSGGGSGGGGGGHGSNSHHRNGGGNNNQGGANSKHGNGGSQSPPLISREKASCLLSVGGGFIEAVHSPLTATGQAFLGCVPRSQNPALGATLDVIRCGTTATAIPLGVIGLIAAAPEEAGGALLTAGQAAALAKLGLAIGDVALGGLETCDRIAMGLAPEEVRNFHSAPAENLGITPNTPLHVDQLPAADTVNQTNTSTNQAVQEIRASVQDRIDIPSSASVRDQQGNIRSQVCAKVPSNGAGGCPKGS